MLTTQTAQVSNLPKTSQTDLDLPHVQLEMGEDHIAILTFDRAHGSANIFDDESLDELGKHLDWLEGEPELKGVILISAKPGIFLAGADLETMSQAGETELERFAIKGQSVFGRLANLSVPTVAAIHGACLGGGLELALACDWRIATPDKVTSLGLPEIQLGILPAWGGCTRLPKLIGLPKALKLILAGSRLNGKRAKKLGIVDSLVHCENLVAEARARIAHGKPVRSSQVLVNNPVSASIFQWVVGRNVKKQTRDNYPAPALALEVVCRGVSGKEVDSLKREQVALQKLLKTDAARNLIRVFLLQQRSRRLVHSQSVEPVPTMIQRTAVIGAGVMGAGIAQWISSRGMPVVMQDLDHARVAAGMKAIQKTYSGGIRRGLFTGHEATQLMERIAPTAEKVPLHLQDVVIEAAVENLDLKKQIFAELCTRTREDAILATNTSALPISDLANAEGIINPGRILGLHFFNPVHRMKLVEIVVAEQTTPEAVEAALRFIKKIGKLPVIVGDSPGFLVNRILMPYLIAAGKLFDGGFDANEIDEAMLDFGMPMGPLRLLDEIGLEVAMHVADTMEASFGERLAAPSILRRLVEHDFLGRKSGAGFFSYSNNKKKPPSINEEALSLRSAGHRESPARNTISTLLAGLTVQEAKLCLQDHVAKSPDDVDFAMIMGTGWAPHRGGPMQYLDALGEAEFAQQFEAAQDAVR